MGGAVFWVGGGRWVNILCGWGGGGGGKYFGWLGVGGDEWGWIGVSGGGCTVW